MVGVADFAAAVVIGLARAITRGETARADLDLSGAIAELSDRVQAMPVVLVGIGHAARYFAVVFAARRVVVDCLVGATFLDALPEGRTEHGGLLGARGEHARAIELADWKEGFPVAIRFALDDAGTKLRVGAVLQVVAQNLRAVGAVTAKIGQAQGV